MFNSRLPSELRRNALDAAEIILGVLALPAFVAAGLGIIVSSTWGFEHHPAVTYVLVVLVLVVSGGCGLWSFLLGSDERGEQ